MSEERVYSSPSASPSKDMVSELESGIDNAGNDDGAKPAQAGANSSARRIIILLCFILISIFFGLAVRCFYLQYLRANHYSLLSMEQQKSYLIEKPQRGVILDCRGRVLAASSRIQSIFAEPRIINDPERTAAALAPIVNMGAGEIIVAITSSKNPGFVKIKTGAEPDECNAAAKIPGIGVQSDWRRYYPTGPLACHIVGFTGSENHGLSGLELQYDKDLTGSPRRDVLLADVYRRPFRLKEQDGVLNDGAGIILTVDAAIQQFARSELLKQYESYQAASAVAIVAEPKSGAILAMVSLPDYDPAAAGSADPNKWRNRTIVDQFEPGSIIKPFVAAIALDTGVVTTSEKIFCEYGNYHGKGFGQIGEYGSHRFGELTIREILAESSNIGMAKIGQKLGKDRLYNGLHFLGFGKRTGIELPGEAEGSLSAPGSWTGYSVTRIPFGQEIATTAIQLMRAFCIISNGGHAVQPYLVRAMVDSNGNITKISRPPPQAGFIVKPETAQWIVREALADAVNEGTGKVAKLKKWQVFGKTGTANISEKNQKGYSEGAYVASFMAGAPVENPRVVVLVSICRPNSRLGKGYTGGKVAAPVAASILEKTLNYLENQQQ